MSSSWRWMARYSSLHRGFTAIGIRECIISKCGFRAKLIPKWQSKEIGELRARSCARNACNDGNLTPGRCCPECCCPDLTAATRSDIFTAVVFVKTSNWLLVAILSLTVGFHWTLLQSVAWVGMIIEYSGQGSFQRAVANTFDGQHPCPICKLVRAGKNAEGKSECRQTFQKFDLFADRSAGFYFPPSSESPFFRLPLMTSRLEAPPIPPPRTISG